MTKIVDSESFIFTFEDETLRSLDKDWTIQAGEGLAMESEAETLAVHRCRECPIRVENSTFAPSSIIEAAKECNLRDFLVGR